MSTMKPTDSEMKDGDSFGRFAGGSLLVTGGIFVSASSLLLLNVVLSSALGAYGMGLVALSTRYVTIISVITMAGIPPIVTQMVAASETSSHRGRIFSTSIGIIAALSIVSVVILVLASEALAYAVSTPEISALLIIQSIGIPFTTVSVTVSAQLRGLEEFKRYSMLQAFGPVLNLLVVIILVAGGAIDPVLAVTAGAIGAILTAVLAFSIGGFVQVPRPSSDTARSMLTLGLPLLMVALSWSVIDGVDVLILRYVGTSVGDVGAYSNAYVLSTYLRYLVEPLAIVIMPMASGLLAASRRRDTQQLLNAGTRYIAVLFTPLAVAFAVAGRSVLLLLYPSEFAVASGSFSVLVLGTVALTFYFLVSRILIAQGATALLSAIVCASCALDVLLTFILSRVIGLLGAAISSSVSFSIMGILAYAAMKRRTGLCVKPRLQDGTLWILVLIADSVSYWAISLLPLDTYWWGPLLQLGAVLATNFLVLFLYRPLTQSDFQIVCDMLDSIGLPSIIKRAAVGTVSMLTRNQEKVYPEADISANETSPSETL